MLPMKISAHLKFSFGGFSSKRMAWILVLLSACLFPFQSRIDFRWDEYVLDVAFTCALGALILGFFIPRNEKNRFRAAGLAFFLFIFHGLLCRL
jgi:hypothetical protein